MITESESSGVILGFMSSKGYDSGNEWYRCHE